MYVNVTVTILVIELNTTLIILNPLLLFVGIIFGVSPLKFEVFFSIFTLVSLKENSKSKSVIGSLDFSSTTINFGGVI